MWNVYTNMACVVSSHAHTHKHHMMTCGMFSSFVQQLSVHCLSSRGKVHQAASPPVFSGICAPELKRMDPPGLISAERRLPKLRRSNTFTSGYLQETALSSDSLVIVVLMFVYS